MASNYYQTDNAVANKSKVKKLPQPRPGGGGFKASVLALLALALVGGAAFWLYSEPQTREKIRDEAAEKINEAASGTILAGIGDILRSTPAPFPEELLNPPTEKGTLSGRTITASVASSGCDANSSDNGIFAENAAAGTQASPSGYIPPVTEDSRVRPDYIAEVANWLAARYQPGPRGGTLAMNIQTLNHLGAVSIARQSKGGRASLLRYAFQPSMIQGLYNLYINRFMDDLNSAAARHGLTGIQNRQFHLALAGRALLVAGSLDGIGQVPKLGQRLAAIDDLAQKTVDINDELAKAVFELDELRNTKAGKTSIKTAQMRVNGITARYRRAVSEHSAAQQALVEDIRKRSDQTLDDDSLLFLASWVERRLNGDSFAPASLQGCAGILRDLAKRCSQAASNS